MSIVAIDPGCDRSAWIRYDGRRVVGHGKEDNAEMLDSVLAQAVLEGERVIIEQIASYGMPVGAEVFATVFWAGRFAQRVGFYDLMPRKAVKLHLCGQTKAKDSNIRQALIDRFGGKDQAIGKKATPGPLYGIKADEWQALALAVTWHDLKVANARNPF